MRGLLGRLICTQTRTVIFCVCGACLLASCDSAPGNSEPITEITVLFGYTTAVADSMGAAEVHVREAVEATNTVYREAHIPMRLVPVRSIVVDYAPTDRLTDLGRLLDPRDGILDNVHAARDEYEADVVVLVTADRSATINAATLATAETAFAMVWWRGLGAPFYAMAHELAHLHGARHEVIRDPSNEPFPYGHGFRSDSLRTIMAGGPARLLPRFSGPDQIHEGVVLGDSATADVARVLRETAVYVSNFRGPKTPTAFVAPGTWPTIP